MSYLMTWNSRIRSPSIVTLPYLMGLSIHMYGECMRREQSRIGIIIRLIQWSRTLFVLISQPVYLPYIKRHSFSLGAGIVI